MPDLAAEYVAVEVEIGHRFTDAISMAELVELGATEEPVAIPDWDA